MITSLETQGWSGKDYAWLFLAFFPAAVLTWGIHEGAHYVMGDPNDEARV